MAHLWVREIEDHPGAGVSPHPDETSLLWPQVVANGPDSAELLRRGEARSAEWAVTPLDGGAVALGGDTDGPDESQRGGSALLLRSRRGAEEIWLVMSTSPRGVRLNGAPLSTGIRVLADRDELQLDGRGRFFFSTERLVRIETYGAGERPVVCPRCKLPIEVGTLAVCCPQCAVWHHQSVDSPCWIYSEHCALCPQPTPLDCGYRWTPEGL